LDDVITGTDPKENASTVAWLCIVACLSVAIATVVNTCYIAYSIHVTISFVIYYFIKLDLSFGGVSVLVRIWHRIEFWGIFKIFG
jgi:hypothetical protein